MRPFQVVKTFVVDATGQPICYGREEATAQRIAYNELERHSADALPPKAKVLVRPEHLSGVTFEWPKVSMLDDENPGERWLEENAEGIR